MDDREWQFGVPSLPSPQELESRQLIKEITLSTKGQKQDMLLKLEPVHPNRAISGEPLCRFVLISFANFRPPGRHADGSQANALQPATPKECTDYITRLLRTGVWLNGVNYNFYGHSNSQLKSRTCYLFAASKSEINLKIEALGDFTKMKTAAKKAKRIGLLFSVANVATIVDPRQCEDISDVETADYLFTDGCGLISPRLARELARRTRIVFRDRRYTPSVFQIRYRGYKGVVTLDLGMNEGPVLLKLRKSMKKFSGGDDYSFSVVEYSKVWRPHCNTTQFRGWAGVVGIALKESSGDSAIHLWISQRRDHHPSQRSRYRPSGFLEQAGRALCVPKRSHSEPSSRFSVPVLRQHARGCRKTAHGVARGCPI